ncbi:MAG: hypothetical protein WKF77_05360 [Planctomycetaceae bacterium]
MSHRLIPGAIGLLFLGLLAHRIWRYASFEQQSLQMPPQVVDAEEQNLFRSPAGRYSLADIAANGNLFPSEKFSGFRARHDYRPQSGDQLCPITRTKAHRDCTWIVGGQTYKFCCPPCIAEFVRQAKTQPENILPPHAYVMK